MSTNSFPQLDLRALPIKDKLLSIYHPGSWWFSIENALVKGTYPLRDIFKMILDQYEGAPDSVLDVIPQDTINQIKALYGR